MKLYSPTKYFEKMRIQIIIIIFLLNTSCAQTKKKDEEREDTIATQVAEKHIETSNNTKKNKSDEWCILIEDTTSIDSAGIMQLSSEICKRITDTIIKSNPNDDFMLSFIEKDDDYPLSDFTVFYDHFSSLDFKEYLVYCGVLCGYKGPAGLLFLTEWNGLKKYWQTKYYTTCGNDSLNILDINNDRVREIETINFQTKAGTCITQYRIFNLLDKKINILYENEDFNFDCGQILTDYKKGDTIAASIDKIEVNEKYVIEYLTYSILKDSPKLSDSNDLKPTYNIKKIQGTRKVKLKSIISEPQ